MTTIIVVVWLLRLDDGSAPWSISTRIRSTSLTFAARIRGVAPLPSEASPVLC